MGDFVEFPGRKLAIGIFLIALVAIVAKPYIPVIKNL